ncbi:Membrane protein, distant similarity to thiosulphate:quinone oxidoreductase DoxD [hydrothermal vent metagenome]|uniref:Membrane protein, distant similarity to thiosulphate:quinone oxidoreductase DoxD n=1 Tax=hydrothermal vent metagenome TaxID=652676 RepID=A0A3B1CIC3_9ZZZZ
MKMFLKTLKTDDAYSSLILRVAMGLIMFPHGAQKLFGWFGGFGFSGTMGYFTETMGIPVVIAFLVIMGESLGALALIAGFLTRFSAASLAVIMLGAITMAHWEHGFLMNWSGNQAGEGYEYHLLVIAICVALTLTGGGKWSVDKMISQKINP